MVPARTAHAVLVILAILAVTLLVTILLPFATPLFIAAVLAGALAPWVRRLAGLLGGRRAAAAGLLTAAVLVAVVGPLSALGAVLVPQIQNGLGWLRQAMQNQTFQHLAEGARAAAVLGNLLSATGTFLFHSLLMLIALYFLLLDGDALVEWLSDAIPLKPGQVSELLRDFRTVTVTVLVSTIATGGVQSLVALVG